MGFAPVVVLTHRRSESSCQFRRGGSNDKTELIDYLNEWTPKECMRENGIILPEQLSTTLPASQWLKEGATDLKCIKCLWVLFVFFLYIGGSD